MSALPINNRINRKALKRIKIVGREHGIPDWIVERIVEAYESAKNYLEKDK